MRKVSIRLAVLSVAGLSLAGLGMAAPAGAATGFAGARIVHGSLATKVPTTDIEGNGAKAKFVPDTLKVKQYTEAACSGTSAPTSVEIVNKGTAAAELYQPGTGPVLSLASDYEVGICLYGAKKGAKGELVGLSNASGSKVYKATLSVTITNS